MFWLQPRESDDEMPEFYCFATFTLVQHNKMRPGYDCRCSGCMAYLKAVKDRRDRF